MLQLGSPLRFVKRDLALPLRFQPAVPRFPLRLCRDMPSASNPRCLRSTGTHVKLTRQPRKRRVPLRECAILGELRLENAAMNQPAPSFRTLLPESPHPGKNFLDDTLKANGVFPSTAL